MIDEALAYFSGDAGYRRLFSLFWKKYQSLGRIGGTVNIDSFTDDEIQPIARFFGVTAAELKQKGSVSLTAFEKQLAKTKFEGIDLKVLLEVYYNQPLISKKEEKQLKMQQQNSFFNQLENDFPKLFDWIHYLRKKNPDTYWIHRLMDESREDFILAIHDLEKAFTTLPAEYERLPIFSSRITQNPHAFDLNTNLGRMLIHLLAVDHAGYDLPNVPNDTEGINNLLLTYNILRDDITNYVTCANLLGETVDGLHPVWEAASRTQSVMNVPLRELFAITGVQTVNAKKAVWIVENSGVYSSILDKLPSVPLICTHGQFKLAALLLMDLLVQEGYTLCYAGDFDPEGISMAERLKRRYPQHVTLWKMDNTSYQKAEADMELSDERLKKLDSITTPELLQVVDEMKQRKRAGYQEALIHEMVSELADKVD